MTGELSVKSHLLTLVVCHHGGAGLVGSLGVNQVG